MVERIFVEKKSGFDTGAKQLMSDIANTLGIRLSGVRKILRYDVEGVEKEALEKAKVSIFSEPPVDNVFHTLGLDGYQAVVAEYLDGQYDQRADSAAQCVQLLTAGKKPLVRCATVYLFQGLTESELAKIKKFLINPVDSREGNFNLPETLERKTPDRRAMRLVIPRFIDFSEKELKEFYEDFGFAMNYEDLVFVQQYFREENRNPTHTELKAVDTYWSDHCRHTTFLTEITDVSFKSENPHAEAAWESYRKVFGELYKDRTDKYPCLMDIATLAVKKLKKDGYLKAIDESEEINACSVRVDIDVDGKDETWLVMFKNETHNHPTEIEPFGGAATCLGGAIRDPLSGRSYVYQAMRITGAGNVNEDFSKTMEGKLPQRVLSKTALAGFSCYGNQIGLATGIVREIYNDGYKAKRLETGYVIGAAPSRNVIRERPQPGDIVILVGGNTGRDGCGGATGSSKSHTAQSLDTCGAEVQKGNAPEERKLQRLFRNGDAAKKIIRCNDFGAGGVCVAIGELASGLKIELDKVPVKYDGLNATELAISESQERMAVVVRPKDAESFLSLARGENLKATIVATVTDDETLTMVYKNEEIVRLKRSFLDTNGVKQTQRATVNLKQTDFFNTFDPHVKQMLDVGDPLGAMKYELSKLNNCSQKGAGETFDSTIGGASVFLPFGGKKQLTPALVMASKPPVSGKTSTVTLSSFGLNVDLMAASPFTGAIYSVVLAVNKLVASGAKRDTIYLTLQEFFKRLKKDDTRWGEPVAALLGAFDAQMNLKIGAIGGKDSMSGTFEDIDVPPTVIAFGMGVGKDDKMIHNAFAKQGNVYRIKVKKDEYGYPDFQYLGATYVFIENLIEQGKLQNTTVVENNVAVSLVASLLGNGAGFAFTEWNNSYLTPAVGDFILVSDEDIGNTFCQKIGILNDSGIVSMQGSQIGLSELEKSYTRTLENIYPTTAKDEGRTANVTYSTNTAYKGKSCRPRVFIPVFPGTNCEFDTARAFGRAGAETDIFVVRNLTASDIESSIQEMAKRIGQAQIIAFPGGFSGGDEPDGSGKFIATAFRNPVLKTAVENLLYQRDGLALGICNGFQALIKLGLLPFGKVEMQKSDSATLTYNTIARHVSTVSRIRIASNASPWLCTFSPGEIFSVPVSHGEGKLIAPQPVLEQLVQNGQVATQYVDLNGNATMESPYNPNGSFLAIEGLLSPDGRVFGKMGHTERFDANLYQNVEGNFDMNIFKNAVNYFA